MFRGGPSKTLIWQCSIRDIGDSMVLRQIMTAQEGMRGGTTRSSYLRDLYSDENRATQNFCEGKQLRESRRTHATNLVSSCHTRSNLCLPSSARAAYRHPRAERRR